MSEARRSTLTGRVARSLLIAKGDIGGARAFCAAQNWDNVHAVDAILKSSVMQGSDGIASTSLGADLLPLVRARSIIGRLQGLRPVPFDTPLLTQNTGAAGAFVAEGRAIPVLKSSYARTILSRKKVGAISVVTNELVACSKPSADRAIADDLADALALTVDQKFIDPSNAGDAATPAAVTNGCISIASSGPSLAQIDTDLGLMIDNLINSGSTLLNAAWVMSGNTANFLSRLRGSGGNRAFPDIGPSGGLLVNLPVLTSLAVPHLGSPTSSSIALVDAAQIRVCDEGEVELSVGRAAVIEMLDNPVADGTVPTAASGVSMFQTECGAVKAVHYVNWSRSRVGGVVVLTGVGY